MSFRKVSFEKKYAAEKGKVNNSSSRETLRSGSEYEENNEYEFDVPRPVRKKNQLTIVPQAQIEKLK